MPAILFVCIGNACRSQIAEAYLCSLAKEQNRHDIQVFSAGSSPLGYIPQETITVMAEVGIDLSQHSSKGISAVSQQEFNYVVSLCGDYCPYVPAEQHISWNIPDPFGGDWNTFRNVREEIKQRVMDLLKEI